jgi:hypothetical protein
LLAQSSGGAKQAGSAFQLANVERDPAGEITPVQFDAAKADQREGF